MTHSRETDYGKDDAEDNYDTIDYETDLIRCRYPAEKPDDNNPKEEKKGPEYKIGRIDYFSQHCRPPFSAAKAD